MQCIEALVHLQQQSLIQREDCTYASDLLFDQLTILAKCLPILLLRVPQRLAAATKAFIVIKTCNRFWKGAWQSLALGAQQDLQVCNVLAQEKNHAAQQQPPDTASVHSAQVLERARQLQYSKAMNLLRSPGLARQSLEEIAETLQALHPQEGQLDLDQTLSPDEGGSLNASTVAFITGKWFSRQIRSSAKGTAVDQWGCD